MKSPILILLFCVTLSASALAQVDAVPQLKDIKTRRSSVALPSMQVSHRNIHQGQAFKVTLSDAPLGQDYYVSFAGRQLKLYKGEKEQYIYLPVKGDLKVGGYTLHLKDAYQNEVDTAKLEVLKGAFYTQHIRYYRPKPDQATQDILDKENALVDAASEVRSEERLWDSAFMLPVPHRVTANYGTRRYLNGKYNGYHSGVDFASPFGYPIKAPHNATVTLAKYFSKYNANGNLVFLDHGAGVTSVYIHLSKIAVKEGQKVNKGQTIGYIGSTGRSTGPHLHWGLYLNGQNTDGLAWVKYTKTLF